MSCASRTTKRRAFPPDPGAPKFHEKPRPWRGFCFCTYLARQRSQKPGWKMSSASTESRSSPMSWTISPIGLTPEGGECIRRRTVARRWRVRRRHGLEGLEGLLAADEGAAAVRRIGIEIIALPVAGPGHEAMRRNGLQPRQFLRRVGLAHDEAGEFQVPVERRIAAWSGNRAPSATNPAASNPSMQPRHPVITAPFFFAFETIGFENDVRRPACSRG